ALAFVAIGNMGENLVYYWSPSEMMANGQKAMGAEGREAPTIRLGGIVVPGSLKWDEATTTLKFKVADDHKKLDTAVDVVGHEVPPQMFREGIGVVVEGTWDKTHVFSSNRLMVNHSNEYKPPTPEQENSKDWQEKAMKTTVGIK
ncbi:MAG: cytochrome c maturation protein CcmE, partial [Myxococcaceae bacterium]